MSDSWVTLFTISLIHCDRMGLAWPGKTTDVLLECDNPGCQKFPVAVHVFGADLAQVLANGEQQGDDMTHGHKRLIIGSEGTLKMQVL